MPDLRAAVLRSGMPRWFVLSFTVTMVLGCATDMENTAPPPGALGAFAPFAHVGAVAAYAGRNAKLMNMTASRVPSSGLMPLSTDPQAHVDHTFYAEDEDGHKLQVTVNIMNPREYQVSTNDPHGHSRERSLGMKRVPAARDGFLTRKFREVVFGMSSLPAPTTIDLPKCTAAELWKKAMADGVPQGGLANISYTEAGYELIVPQSGDRARRFDKDCKLLGQASQGADGTPPTEPQ